MSSLNNCIKFSLDIKDENIVFSNYLEEQLNGKFHKIYLAELIQPACPYCHSVNLKHNGHYLSNIRFITADASRTVTIRLKKQRVICKQCHKRSMAQSDLVNKYCHISNASKRKVLAALTEDRSMTSIAREHNLSVNTVQRIISLCSHNFHMVQVLTRSFNSLRVILMKNFERSSRQYQLLKSPWKLYLKKYDDLDKIHPRYNWHYKDSLTQEQVVNEGIACNKVLENSYNLMQEFFSALHNGDLETMKRIILSNERVGYLMHKTLLTFRHNFTAVLNGAQSNYSNGCLEGFNRKIKQIERTAYGYSNFINLLTRIRLEENKIKEKEPSYSEVA